MALVAAMLAGGWYFSSLSDSVVARTPNSPAGDVTTILNAPNSTEKPLPVKEPLLVASTAALSNTSQQRPAHERSRELFEQLLGDYRSNELSPDEKILIEQTLRGLNHESLGQTFIIDTFFSTDAPQLAESLYNLILDADLRDVELLEALIQRDSTEFSMHSKARILDLIADLSAQDDAPYSAAIDHYLEQATRHPEEKIRDTAASRRIWYLAQHQPDNLAALNEYLLNNAATVREEVYSLIESRIANTEFNGQAEISLALGATLHANYLGLSDKERSRATALLETLTNHSVSL